MIYRISASDCLVINQAKAIISKKWSIKVEFSKSKGVLHEEVEIYQKSGHGCVKAR